MAQALPILNSFGVFTLLPPFTITAVNYRCSSLQLIIALVNNGVNVFDIYYTPNNLTNAQYEQDIINNTAIVTLESNDGPTINVPSSFVNTTPVALAVPYSRLVVSLELGELPDQLPLTGLLEDLQVIANNYIGVTSIPKLHKIPINTNYSFAEYQVKEAQRLLAVQRHISFYTEKVNADTELALAKQQIRNLEAALIVANSLIPIV